jgi:PAS domain-containing protein
LLEALRRSSDVNKNNLFMMIIALTVLFASFIALCGFTHAFAAASHFLPTAEFIHVTFLIVLVMCAVVSMATAVAGHQLFPLILNVLSKYELNSEGNLQHVENYLIEVVELVKESVVVFSEQLKILRCNEASKVLFGSASLVHERVTKFIHPDDIKAFEKAVQQAMLTYDQTPVTVEYRVRSSKSSAAAGPSPVVPLQAKRPAVLRSAPSLRWSGSASTAKIFATIAEDPQDTSAVTQFPVLSNETSFAASGSFSVSDIGSNDALTADDFTWVESTMCKGMRFSSSEEFEYDVKMVTRNIEDRRKQALEQYENILRATEEEARINAAKLRYISCIAHDLKTPLQSFCFSLDLLAQSPLHPEQREFIEQANVAVDLMKLTISQTMDISKALTGAKLQPRRTTVCLSSVLHRVKVIM